MTVLAEKYRQGIFDNPYIDEEGLELSSDEHHALAVEIAQKSLVLLKNEELLPCREVRRSPSSVLWAIIHMQCTAAIPHRSTFKVPPSGKRPFPREARRSRKRSKRMPKSNSNRDASSSSPQSNGRSSSPGKSNSRTVPWRKFLRPIPAGSSMRSRPLRMPMSSSLSSGTWSASSSRARPVRAVMPTPSSSPVSGGIAGSDSRHGQAHCRSSRQRSSIHRQQRG